MDLSSVSFVVIENEKFFNLQEVCRILKIKAYTPDRIKINKDFVRKERILTNKKVWCVSINGVKELLYKTKTKKAISINKIESLARKYGWSYGFVSAHMALGDLEERIKEVERVGNIKPRTNFSFIEGKIINII